MSLTFEFAIVIAQFALCLALVALVIKLVAIAISNGFDSPFLATPHTYLPKIEEALAIRPNDVVYELGCGDGRLVFFCAGLHPKSTFVGIERNPLLVTYARLQKTMRGNPHNVSFRCEDFFNTDLRGATRIFVYLLPVTLNKLFADPRTLEKKRLVSRAYTLTNRKPSQVIALSETPGTHGEHVLHVYGE